MALRESLRQAGEVDQFGDLPMVVLSSSEMRRGGVFEEEANRINKVILTLHAELAGLSTNSVHRIVAGAGHYIHWDKPEAVVTAVRDVLWAVRNREPFVASYVNQEKALFVPNLALYYE